ncbi:MAG: hypothetical protein CMJ83_22070 [Planctomycetes bacterium]|nr:hypothetical protein [Planctomycetota bacterium]
MTDRVLVAITHDGRYRARAATTTEITREAIRRHGAGPLAAEALARAVTCAAVFPATWKDCERVSVQWSGGGPLRTLMAEIRPGGLVRGYVGQPAAGARCDHDGYRGIAHGLLPAGFVVVIRQNINGTFQQGQITLPSGEIDEDLEAFFETSDQVPTRLRAMTQIDAETGDVAHAAGVLVQALPDDYPPELAEASSFEDFAPTTSPEDLLERALGRPYDVLEEIPLTFACPCSRGRMADGIALLEVDELLDMINEDQGASVRCDYCGESQRFNREELEDIMVRKVTGKNDT